MAPWWTMPPTVGPELTLDRPDLHVLRQQPVDNLVRPRFGYR
ncbi:hypothetical protein ACFH04_24090 [Streptomyces noboritoensis]|uniref:Uncharacterized protein n=1 Tax=Streptomyces noboritoensis TaxID=67337 RepID=A0ABV6TLW4_9ACTN